MSSSNPSGPLFPLRTAVVLLLALLTGVGAGVLTFFTTHSLPGAVLAGGGATGGSLVVFHALIGG